MMKRVKRIFAGSHVCILLLLHAIIFYYLSGSKRMAIRKKINVNVVKLHLYEYWVLPEFKYLIVVKIAGVIYNYH